MSLTRNPNMMAYSVAGINAHPREKLHVQSNVHVPSAEIGEDFDGRMSFSAPDHVYRRKRTWDMSFATAALLIGMTLFVMLMLVGSTLLKQNRLNNQYNDIIIGMHETKLEIDKLLPKVEQARNSAIICYRAAQEFGMVDSVGVEAIEIYAPETRPADSSLSAGNIVAWLVN